MTGIDVGLVRLHAKAKKDVDYGMYEMKANTAAPETFVRFYLESFRCHSVGCWLYTISAIVQHSITSWYLNFNTVNIVYIDVVSMSKLMNSSI